MNKVILITGTSTGLGLAIAVQAAQAGHIVYATMRDTDKRGRLDAPPRRKLGCRQACCNSTCRTPPRSTPPSGPSSRPRGASTFW